MTSPKEQFNPGPHIITVGQVLQMKPTAVKILIEEHNKENIERFHRYEQLIREEERKIIKLRIDYDRKQKTPAEETIDDLYNSIELKTLNYNI